jgi:hypothetical protein
MEDRVPIVISICFIGVIGLVGFAIIDNAAHLGGLIAGGFVERR